MEGRWITVRGAHIFIENTKGGSLARPFSDSNISHLERNFRASPADDPNYDIVLRGVKVKKVNLPIAISGGKVLAMTKNNEIHIDAKALDNGGDFHEIIRHELQHIQQNRSGKQMSLMQRERAAYSMTGGKFSKVARRIAGR